VPNPVQQRLLALATLSKPIDIVITVSGTACKGLCICANMLQQLQMMTLLQEALHSKGWSMR
jgi:hypothetical protein